MVRQKGLAETELQGVTGVSQDPGESDEAYRFRLVDMTNDALPDCWEELSSFTQQYYNDCVSRLSESKDVPAFPVHPDDITGDDMSTETMTPRTTSGQFAKKSDTAPPADKSMTPATPDATPVIGVATKDTYGLRLGTLSSRAAEMFTKGAKMAEVKKETGINHYNLLRKLEASGHTVTREDAVITLTRGGDGGFAGDPDTSLAGGGVS
jgi:hypothetical protein